MDAARALKMRHIDEASVAEGAFKPVGGKIDLNWSVRQQQEEFRQFVSKLIVPLTHDLDEANRMPWDSFNQLPWMDIHGKYNVIVESRITIYYNIILIAVSVITQKKKPLTVGNMFLISIIAASRTVNTKS